MISYIKGTVKFIDENSVCVVSNDVGWNINVYVPEKYLIESNTEFYVYTHIRESEFSLWGFESLDQLRCFKLLLSVSGVGPRTAQSLIGDKGVNQIYYSISNNDEKTLRVPGVGLKTSQKIIIELKNKVNKIVISTNEFGEGQQAFSIIDSRIFDELSDALSTLGYRNSDIQSFIANLDDSSKQLSTEELIKKFLRSI